MSHQGSYKIQQFATNAENEIKRLNAQLNLFWEKELIFYRMFGLKDGMAIVECGSGPGFMTQKLIEAFPKIHVTALEVDQYLLEFHKKNMPDDLSGKYEIIERSMLETGFEDGSFDFAIARLVLEHLPDPFCAVKEVLRILKPGGKAVFVDNDFELHLRTYPDIPELKDLYEAYCNARHEEGGSPKIGRRLPNILKSAGFSNIDLQIVCAHNQVTGDEIFAKSEGAGIPSQLLENGYLSQEVLDRIAVKWHSMLQDKNHSIFRQLFMAVGEKVLTSHTDEKSAQTIKEKLYKKSITRNSLLTANKEDAINMIECFLCEEITALLDVSEQDVQPEAEFSSLGFDSISAVELHNHIKSKLGVNLSITSFLGNQRITDIVKQLLQIIAKDQPKVDNSVIQILANESKKAVALFPLSYNQKSLWLLYQFVPHIASYNMGVAFQIKSGINKENLLEAFKKLVLRHPILRTTYDSLNQMGNVAPRQQVHNKLDPEFVCIDTGKWSDEDIRSKVQKYYAKPFDLTNGPILRAYLFTHSQEDHIMLIVTHHIASDAGSLNILFDELPKLYQAEADQISADLSPVTFKYTDYVQQQNRLIKDKGDSLLNYWKSQLAGIPPLLHLPTDYKRPPVQQFEGTTHRFIIEAPLYKETKLVARKQNCTTYVLLLSIFQALMMRYSNQRDIAIGTLTTNPIRSEYEPVYGYFVNPIVLRSRFSPDTTFKEHLLKTRSLVFEALEHQEYPFPLLVEKLCPKRDPSYSPLFQVLFSMLKRKTLGIAADFLFNLDPEKPVDFGPLRAFSYPIYQQEGQFDLTLDVIDMDAYLLCDLKYCPHLFKAKTIEGMAVDYQVMLGSILKDPQQRLDSFPIKNVF